MHDHISASITLKACRGCRTVRTVCPNCGTELTSALPEGETVPCCGSIDCDCGLPIQLSVVGWVRHRNTEAQQAIAWRQHQIEHLTRSLAKPLADLRIEPGDRPDDDEQEAAA
jgi:hypothetical protein